jgi:hypothetical protein
MSLYEVLVEKSIILSESRLLTTKISKEHKTDILDTKQLTKSS